MRISDWSSDVCSSDLGQRSPAGPDHGRRLHSSGRSRGPRGGRCRMTGASGPRTGLPAMRRFDPKRLWALVRKDSLQAIRDPSTLLIAFALPVVLLLLLDRKRVVQGKRVSVRVDLGGRRTIKKKK